MMLITILLMIEDRCSISFVKKKWFANTYIIYCMWRKRVQKNGVFYFNKAELLISPV